LKAVNPESFRLHHLLAESYASTHRKAEAIREYREVLRLAPRTPGVNYELARLLADTTPADAVELLLAELEVDRGQLLGEKPSRPLVRRTSEAGRGNPILKEALAARASLMDARKALGSRTQPLGNTNPRSPNMTMW
jgi:predicted Zn-dependent protease